MGDRVLVVVQNKNVKENEGLFCESCKETGWLHAGYSPFFSFFLSNKGQFPLLLPSWENSGFCTCACCSGLIRSCPAVGPMIVLFWKVFDVQRKVTYKNLNSWYKELREFRPEIPCIVVANKIDGECIFFFQPLRTVMWLSSDLAENECHSSVKSRWVLDY